MKTLSQHHGRTYLSALILLCLSAAVTSGQTGGSYSLSRSTVAGGGGSSTNGNLRVDGTIGQPGAGSSSADRFAVAGGFWPTAVTDGGPVCSYTLSPASAMVPAGGGSGSFAVQTQGNCSWTATTIESWMTLTGTPGTGTGTVSYAAAANPATTPRTGIITVADKTFTITQAGSCSFSLSPTRQSFTPLAGSGRVQVTAGDGCNWSVTTDVNFISFSPGGGSGQGSVDYLVAANPNPVARRGVILIAGQGLTVLQGAQFSDVPQSHSFFEFIGKLSAAGITAGCGNGNYCPDNPVTREQMAAFIIRALGVFNPSTDVPQRFADVPKFINNDPTQPHPFYGFIDQMGARRITSGCGGGNYCPGSSVTREQMAAFIIKALGVFNPSTDVPQRFADVPKFINNDPNQPNPFYGFIDQMGARGITSGCGGGNYCPGGTVTRGQMAVFLVKAFGL